MLPHISIQPSETRIQALCIQWHWNTFPAYRGLLHTHNNNSHNAIKGALNKALGIVKGVSDLEYFFAGKSYFIELKNLVGYQTLEQKQFQKLVQSQGGSYQIVRSLEEFQHLIERIHTQCNHPVSSHQATCIQVISETNRNSGCNDNSCLPLTCIHVKQESDRNSG
ncbi:hypothetical protein QNI16_13765 [Cytophagaceae bacterium YF14B1]|uniref:VRR-NUC domain-containing protein n=1 Tax=Xanthocytophaga flava TaxID=3048013 RepID=A0AAE3U6Q5_9BACT|nr:hypothetical protein [Xanthocytophaga flavus]MDJ1481561.1 hypothetical protein [Xanthocytophaga flavus]